MRNLENITNEQLAEEILNVQEYLSYATQTILREAASRLRVSPLICGAVIRASFHCQKPKGHLMPHQVTGMRVGETKNVDLTWVDGWEND